MQNTRKLMPVVIALSSAIIIVTGCQSDHSTVVSETNEAVREIGNAQKAVATEKAEGAKAIANAERKGDMAAANNEKIEATKEIAKAERVVEDEKIEATEEVTAAEIKDGATSGTYEKR